MQIAIRSGARGARPPVLRQLLPGAGRGEEASIMAGSGWSDPRPMSPHLQIWRWHVTMATSIFQRASGIANYVGAIIGVAWLVALASGPQAYVGFTDLLFSPLGQLVLFGLAVSYCYHLFGGVRYLFWDAGKGFDPAIAKQTSWLVIALGVLGGVGVFALAHLV
jgi:succinate dehydrogenase / fumarate reductase, cytochrome b subunit